MLTGVTTSIKIYGFRCYSVVVSMCGWVLVVFLFSQSRWMVGGIVRCLIAGQRRLGVEYVFGFMSVSMGGWLFVVWGWCVWAQIVRCNLVYNFKCYVYLAGVRLVPVI